jgi:hypothetical protein
MRRWVKSTQAAQDQQFCCHYHLAVEAEGFNHPAAGLGGRPMPLGFVLQFRKRFARGFTT